MVKVLVVSHGSFASSICETANLFVDTKGVAEALCLLPDDSVDEFQEQIFQKIQQMDDGDGVLILVDIYAGSPCNRTAMVIGSQIADHKVQCLTGVNLPMVTEAVSSAGYMSLEELLADVQEVAADAIKDLRKTLEI